MKANELRIGNYYAHNERIEQVTPNVIMEVWDAPRIWCKPIPLTEEWLLKFGFDPYEIGYQVEAFIKFASKDRVVDKVIIAKGRNGYYLCGIDAHVTIIYVHQLQNLYFALTGEELTIKTK